MGIYLKQDFQDPTSPNETIVRRKTLREELLRRIVTEEDVTFVKTTNWDIHPLEIVLKIQVILEILRKTTAEAAFPPQHPRHSESPKHALLEDDDDLEEIQATRSLDEQLAELIARVKSMEERLAHHQRQTASRIRMADNRPGQNVHFEETFSIPDERDGWTRPSPPPQPARPRDQAGLRAVNPIWVGGDRQNPARSSS